INIPAYLAVDSTRMFAHNLYEYMNHIVADGRIDADSQDEIIREALVTKNGSIVHKGALKAMEEACA
ncbi:MAG TPA: NAD(P)(+) transhydrogenase (Re/Si-specific) subunit alpha, partial [Candidatus Hydrogenedentes bacterium]|nr:NAD(P)(+) transhydrogenase (Re/Si-specific) subunit alpha [Candidatus Hydrogenedentota bacterium]